MGSHDLTHYTPLHHIQAINASLQPVDSGKGKGRGGLTGLLVLSVSAAVIGSSTQFGYNTGVINNPKQVCVCVCVCMCVRARVCVLKDI